MSEKIAYNPDEFTLENYKNLLLLAKSRFVFSNYDSPAAAEKIVYWRHDVDFSLEQALKIAEIEAAHGVQTTYFLYLHSNHYNLLDKNSFRIVQQLIAMGHSLGLHFDASYQEIASLEQLEYWLDFEKKLLEHLFGARIQVFSFHNPNKYALTLDEDHYANMINTYSKHMKNTVQYCSDSNGYWRYRSLRDVLNDATITHLQVLTHPIWWSDDALMPRDKILNFVENRCVAAMASYDHILEKNKRINLT